MYFSHWVWNLRRLVDFSVPGVWRVSVPIITKSKQSEPDYSSVGHLLIRTNPQRKFIDDQNIILPGAVQPSTY